MRFLIIKTSAFGDVVQVYPVIEYLKTLYPDCEIDWVVEKKISSLVRAHPQINRTIEINAKEWKKNFLKPKTYSEIAHSLKEIREYTYDALFDLQGNTKSALITLLAKSRAKVGFGWKTAPERLNPCVTHYRANPPKGQNMRRDYLFIVQSYFKDFSSLPSESVKLLLSESEAQTLSSIEKKLEPHTGKTLWMICPGSQWINKKLPLDTLKELLFKAEEKYNPFYLFLAGSVDELKEAEILAQSFPNSYILHKVTLPVVQHVMAKMDLVFSMDSLPLHLAATTQAKTFSLFGPSVSFKYRPVGEAHFSFQGSCPYGYHFEKRCPILRSCKTGACLRSSKADDIFLALSSWLD